MASGHKNTWGTLGPRDLGPELEEQDDGQLGHRNVGLNREPDPVENMNSLPRLGVLFLYYVLNNHIKCSAQLSLLSLRVPSVNTRLSNLFNVPYLPNNYSFYMPLYCAMRDANEISRDIDFFTSSSSTIKRYVRSNVS
jgi:hypothetical protein